MTSRVRPQTVLSWVLWGIPALVMTMPWLLQPQTGAPVLWWAGRAFGFVAYVALWLAMLTGLLMSSPGLLRNLDRKLVFELHQQWTFAGAIATALHVLAIVTHGESRIDLVSALVPYASARLTGPVALGTLAFWGVALLTVTSWLRSRLSYNTWRVIHTVAFGAFLLALAHAVTTGTDSGYAAVRWLYVTTSTVLITATVMRVVTAFAKKRRPTPAAQRPHTSPGPSTGPGQPVAQPGVDKLAA